MAEEWTREEGKDAKKVEDEEEMPKMLNVWCGWKGDSLESWLIGYYLKSTRQT